MIAALLLALAHPAQCDAPGERSSYTVAEALETKARVQAVCKAVGAKPIVCAYLDSVVARESSGNKRRRHVIGKGENGLGPMGLSLRWQRDKWPGKDEDPMFCVPEVSAVVTLAIMRRAFVRYHAESIVDVQAIFGGRWRCGGEPRRCWADVTPRTVSAICGRLKARGHSCWAPVSLADLGRPIPYRERRAFAERVRAAFKGAA